MSVEDAVKVCLRVRPLILREQGEQVNLVWKAENNTITQVDGSRSFNFDRVFHSHETTAQVYQEVAVPIIRSALHGYNGTIFAYGQTSSGKTYTMMGAPNNLGIIPQAVGEVFKIIQEIPNREFLLRVSYMEIYNESVTDLLCDNRKKKPLEVREDFNRTVYVADLTEEVVTIPEQVMQWIKKGEKHRHYGETKMNDHSSRSHTIFRMIVESRERNDPGNSENCDGAIMVSHLNLVDLAGSERASQTGAEGVRLKEGCNINRSLFILGQVIKKLSDGQVGGFINYRDSKLTRILQNSLGGNTKTVIICTITPISLDETLSTLQFASTAKHVKNTPQVNEVLDDHALLKRYRKEILDLKKQLEGLEASTDIKTQAMAKEEYNQLLSEIKELQKEKEDRICNLGNMMVASTQQSQEDQRVNFFFFFSQFYNFKIYFQHLSTLAYNSSQFLSLNILKFKKRRRVTWAPGKLQDSLHSAGISHFDIASKVTANVAKRPKLSEFSTIPEVDDSTCTDFSEFDETGRILDDLALDADWNSGNVVTYRERTALSYSMMDFSAESSSAVIKDPSLQKCKETEQKVAELENQLKKRTEEYEVEVGKRECLEKEVAELKQAKSRADKDVQTPELEDTSVKDQTDAQPGNGQQSPVTGGHVEVPEKLSLKTADGQEQETLQDLPLLTQIDAVYQDPDKEAPSSNVHDTCWEQIRMLEQKIADLEGSACPENNSQNDLIESLQICEALMAEKESAHEQLGSMQHDFDHLIAENESLKRELADLEKCLEEKRETTEFEMLEKEAQKEHEAQLMYENSNLKTLIDNSEVYNKELENEVESKSKLLLEQEKQITELKRESEILQKKVRYSDLMASMGSGEKLCEEVFQMQKSLTDAETVTRDAQREAAFLRSENLELKERMEELLVRCEKGEKDASDYEKKLEFEKSKYKMMLSDLQKELQHAFNEVNHLNGLMAGKVPNELLSRIELEKKVEDYSKQLANILEEKNELEQKIASFSESLHLCSEVKNLRDQAQRTSEELVLLKSGKEQSASIINDQEHKLEEQSEQLEKLSGEVTQLQVKYQQAEQQYSELKMQHESCSLTVVDQNKNDSEAQCLLMEVECAERQLSAILERKHDLLQAKQGMETRLKEMDELYKSSCMENHKLQGQVDHLFSEVTSLQQLSEKQSELCKEKQDLEEKYNALLSVKEQLQEQLHVYSLSVLQPENAEPSSKLQELQDELNVIIQHRDELLVKMEGLEAEKNNLKQDLSDNIELSIETQEELRTTQEELEQQKKLVADLRQQLADTGDSLPQEDQKDILAEKLSAMTEKLHENETKCESLTNEKLELERMHQNLVSEMKLLQERMHSAELALSKVEEENAELRQNIKEPPKSWELDEMPNIGNLESDPSKQVKQEEEGEGLQLQGQISAMLQEKDVLHQTMKDLTAERDQLKLDLQENIEMSIDIQEELRSALDELKVKTQLLDSLSAQMNEIKVGENGESNRSALQGEVEEKRKKIEELETKVEDVLRNLQDAELKYENMVETLELITKEKDNLISSLTVINNNLVNDLAMCKQDKSTQDCALQVSIEMSTNDQVDIATIQEEIETEISELKETLGQLQQQLNLISQEKEELQQSIDTFKAERCELLTNLQRYVENEALRSEGDLKNKLEKLKEQLKAVKEQQLMAAESEDAGDSTNMEINMPEENVTKNPTLLEEIQEEKLELLGKLSLLQEELQKKTAHTGELQCKLEGMIDENARLRENLESVLSCSSRTQEELQRCQEELHQHITLVTNLRMEASCSTPKVEKETITDLTPSLEEVLDLKENPQYQQLLKEKETLELEKNNLSSEIKGLMEVIKETQSKVVSLQNENLEAEMQRIDLQQQIEAVVQERNHLKSVQQRCVSEMNQETQTEYKDQNTEDGNLQDMEAQFASMSNEKSKIEEKLLHLQQHMEIMTNESNELRVTIQSLQSERDQLKEDLGENVQMSIETQDDLRKAQDDLRQQIQMVEELTCKTACLEQKLASADSERELIELSKEKLLLEREDLHNEIETKNLALDKCEKEGSEAGQKILDLTAQLKAASEERNKMELRNEELQNLSTEIQDDLQKAQEELQQQKHRVEKLTNDISLLEKKNTEDSNLQDMEAQFASMSNEKSKIEEKLLHLQQHMEIMTNESNELRVTIQSLQSERDQLKEDLGENVQMSIETQDDLRKAQDDLQQQIQMVEELTCKTACLEQKLASADSERELIELSKEKLLLEREDLHNEIETKKLALDKCEKEGAEAGQKIFDLTAQLKAASEERNKMELRNEELQKLSTEIQDDLQKAQEELLQQKHRVEKLTNDISLLEKKNTEDGNLQDMEAQFASMSNEKSKIEEKLLHLQQHMEIMTNESNELRVTIQSLQSERDQLKEDLGENVQMSIETQDDLRKAQDDLRQQIQMVEELTCKTASLEQKLASADSERELIELSKEKLLLEREDLHNEIETKNLALDKCEKEGSEAGQKILDLTAQLKAASEERNKMELRNEELQNLSTEIQDKLQKAQEELQQQQHRVENLTNYISLLEKKNTEDGNLQDMEAQFASMSNEKSKIEEKLLHLQQHMEIMTNESNELRVTIQSLQSERDQLKEDLGENVQMSIETQDDLRKAQEDLRQQIQMVEELTCKTASLEQKLASVENQLQETVLLLKEANSERELIELSKEKLLLEREDLHNEIETKKLALDKCEKERSEAGQKILDLTAQLKAASEERNKMELRNEELQKLSTEIQDDLQKAQEELQQQKHRVEKLTNDISLLKEKSSSLERELEEKNHILDKAAEDRCVFDMSKQNLTTELEQVVEALKSKDFELKEAEKEKAATSQIILELTKEIKSVAQERDDLQNSRQKLEEEAEKLREEIQQQRHERNLLTAEQVRKTNQLNELETELQQLQEKMSLSEASTKQIKTDNIALREQLQQCELDVASLHQEQEQFQQLLQRARSEKENIYSTLQDQEKAVAQVQDELITSQEKLQTVIKERDESREHLLEKVNEVKERLQEISSLQEQMQQLHEEVKAEKRKNFDLLEDVDLLEKEVRALRLMQNEPVQEVDELAGCTEILEEKNNEWKDLMVKIYTVYSDHHSSLNNVSCELQTMTQAQNQSMSTIKESLSSTFSRTFGNLQTEHVKLNSQMQMLLNKFKVLYKSAAVKEEHYSSAEDFENELCVLQKKNDQLLLQCQSLEQCGSKWSETVAEELKFCEIEFMNQMIFKKVDVLKNVEGGFSEVQVVLNSIENELKQEMKSKEEFIEWLSEFQSLHFDAKRLNDGVHQENRRIAGVIQNLTKKLKIIAQSKTKQDTMLYLNTLKAELHEKKEKNMDLLQRMQKIAPSGDSNMLEEENARLCGTLKNVQGELKKMQCRIQDLEKQLSAVESDAKQKEQRALLLEDKLRSKVAESELSEMQVKVNEKEKLLQAAQKEIQILQEKISKGAAPYKDEIENLKSRVVWVEMERVKLSKSTEQQISSLKAFVEDKETRLRKLKEELRRTQKDTDASICSTSSTSPQYPLTCGGGSGIVQSTAMLMLQSQNAALKREIGQYKKKVHHLSRTISSSEDEVKKLKEPSPETPSPLLSSLHSDEVVYHGNADPYRTTLMSPPRKFEMPSGHIASQAKTAIHGDNPRLLSKIDVHKPQPMSPNKMERHSAPAMSPDKTRLYGKRPFSPLKTDGPLLSTITESPPKKHTMLEKVDSPKEKFFDVRSKSLPYCPSKFFDNSSLGTFPDIDFSAGTTADSAINDWWDRTGKTEKPNDCKTS
ncbi:centromere-associated protein E isoform X2 [Ranitomeya variabilis]|uniref:centromere-associated protein E isoform X2 n=1 Tax=Ranitomeya variabilis TaxID=490064 RepID=UPI0040565F0D